MEAVWGPKTFSVSLNKKDYIISLADKKVAKSCSTFNKLQRPEGKQKAPPRWPQNAAREAASISCSGWQKPGVFWQRLSNAEIQDSSARGASAVQQQIPLEHTLTSQWGGKICTPRERADGINFDKTGMGGAMVAVLSEMGEKPIKCQFYEVILRFTKLVHSLRDNFNSPDKAENYKSCSHNFVLTMQTQNWLVIVTAEYHYSVLNTCNSHG